MLNLAWSLREKTMEVEPGMTRTDKLQELLLYVVEGKTIDRSWPAVRWGWIATTTVSLGLIATSAIYYFDAEDQLSKEKTATNIPPMSKASRTTPP